MAKSFLYTKTGDKGSTSLADGTRVEKDCTRIEAYGTIDELSSSLGAVSTAPECPPQHRAQILQIQNMLFNIGSYLATPFTDGKTPAVPGLTGKHIAELESWIDTLDETTPPVNAFILPGGTQLSSFSHIARTVCRRAERRICTLATQEYVDPTLREYINRLSDYLFILARHFNHLVGIKESTWQKTF